MSIAPTVSVIIPNYNHEHYLKQRIDSVLNQTYQDFELIILDDKSTDNSKEIIERYRSHPKVSQIVYNEVNSGTTFKQWNKGVKLAKGELIWLAESDDDASERFLAELVPKFDQHNNLGIVYCDSYYINSMSEKVKRTHIWKNANFQTDRWSNDFINNGICEAADYLFYHNVIENASCTLMKKEMIIRAGFANERLKYVGDTLLYLNILMISDVAYVAKPLNYFRDHPINTSKQSLKNGLNSLEVILSYTEMSPKELIPKEKLKEKFDHSLGEYRSFIIINTKINRNLRLLMKGHVRLIKSDFRYSIKLITNLIFRELFRIAK